MGETICNERMDAVDDVLLDFMRAHEVPSPEDVRAFQDKHPEFADDIEENAAETVRYHLSGAASMGFENEPGDEQLARHYVEAFERARRAT